MNFQELHRQIRAELQTVKHQTFVVTCQVVENHPNRIDVLWTIYIPRPLARMPLFFKSREPARLVDWLRCQLPDLATDPEVPHPSWELEGIGAPPAEAPAPAVQP